ncbi:cytosol aminopeptidase catalytic domain containing family protein, putative [Babesia ovis]|uniref:Cytosol aminopeptidase catalytic domain containing family protein, putative n=1 Tax=Babesia ovis TaxID=5869 RepID=A0A9W5WTS3_BABOV|nr:cytosol aminopeptidase catalytic domain containing family protein, putative [Babesia ovis]
MSHAGGYKSRTWNVSGVTPFVSCAIFFIVGTSLTLIYAFAYVGCVALAEGFAVNVQLARYCYQTRQLITLFAALGVALALLLGLGGRISCLLEQWLLAACYFSCAAYIQANQFNIHFNVIALMRFAAAAAVLSGMAQTAAIYCMSDCAMPGGSPYSMNRITAFFVGCTVAGPLISFWIMGKQYLDVETAIVGSLQFMSESCATLTFLCCLAGTLCVVSAAITTYLFFTIDHNLVIEEVPWFPVLLRSPCRLSSATLRRHLKTLYIPLLWTVNPLFIALAIGATLNSTTSVKLIFWQHLVYSMCAIISVSFLYLLYGDPVCATRDTLKQKVLKTTTLTCDGEDLDEASCRSKLFDGAQLRPMSHKSLGDHCMPRVSRSTQWGLLRGVLWSEWQKHDSTYELCQGPLRSIHEALEAFQCLESTNLYDNVLPMMQQYRSMINCTGMLHGFPFSIDPNWGPLEQLHHILLHQRMVLMSQFERTGKMYTDTLRASLPKVFCGFFERIRTMRLCCMSVVVSITNKSEKNSKDKETPAPKGATLVCSEMPDFAKAMPNCKCCCKDEQTSIQTFVTESISAASQLCDKMLGDMRQHEMLQDTPSKPNYGDLATEKELVCVLLDFCESNMLIVAALLMVEEYLVLQEWLCKLAWHIDDIRGMLNKRRKCEAHSKGEGNKTTTGSTTSCTWECIQHLLAEICALLTKIHNCKIKLLLRLRETSGCCVAAARPDLLCDDIDPTVLLATTRLLVIVVLALLGLLSLEEGLKKRENDKAKQQTQQPSQCEAPAQSPSPIPCSCKGSHYDLASAATEYICVVLAQLGTLDPNRIEKLQDNVVSWYSGLTKSMWQMCPDSTLYERYNYAFQIHEDVELFIDLPKDNIVKECLKNGTKDFASSIKKCEEAFKKLKEECNYTTKCDKEGCAKCTSSETTPGSRETSTEECRCPSNSECTESTIGACTVNVKESVECLVKSIATALSCSADVEKCEAQICVLNKSLEECNFEVVPLCTDKAPECSDSCCKEESSASRFGNLIIQLLSCASEFDKNECSSQQGSNTCCPFSNGAEALTNCNKFTIVSKVLKYCFGCKNCGTCDKSKDGGHEKLPCEVILFFYNVYEKLCITKMLEPCDHCKKDCIPCTTDSQDDCLCELCLELLEICVDDGDILCCAKCWRCRLRCYVFCVKDCEKCKAGEKKQCGDCSCKSDDGSSSCQCSTTCSTSSDSAGKSQCCEKHCDLTCLINSLFHCDTCLKNTQCPTTTTTATPTTTTDCLCSKPSEMVYGSSIAMGTKCCEHRFESPKAQCLGVELQH